MGIVDLKEKEAINSLRIAWVSPLHGSTNFNSGLAKI
jgi:hypothetical protein